MRKYFPRLLGNDDTAARVGSAIARGRAPHAFLISGPHGSGKLTLATEIAAALNCERGNDESCPLPCGECGTCRRIYGGNYTDLKAIAKPKDRATIGVDHVKDLREDMFLSSTEARYKVYIIRDAETMTAEAQNALLKVLEEPPSRVVILLLASECDKILTTIKSRVQYIAMSRFSESELSELLPHVSEAAARLRMTDPAKLSGIIMSADGVLGRAIRLTDPKLSAENDADRAAVLGILRAMRTGVRYSEVREAMQRLPSKRPELQRAIESVTVGVRDLIAVKYSQSARMLFFSTRDEAAEISDIIGEKRLIAIYDALREAHEYCAKNAGVANVVTNLTAKIYAGR